MERERRTRQSNREYKQRIRQERISDEGRGRSNPRSDQTEYFSVIPKQDRRTTEQGRTAATGSSEGRREATSRTTKASGRRSSSAKRRRDSQGHSANRSRSASQSRSTAQSRGASQGRNTAPGRNGTVSQSRNGQGNVSGQRRTGQSRNDSASRNRSEVRSRDVRAAEERSRRSRQEERYEEMPKKKSVYFDYTLVFIVFFLSMFGLLMLYTASIYTNNFFRKQCVIAILAFVVLFIFSKIDYHLYAKKWMFYLIAIGAVGSVLLLWTPLGVEINHAKRWIGVGSLTVQPAEIYKIALILVNAVLITKLSNSMHKWKTLGVFALITLFSLGLILVVAENLSSALIVAAITVLMVFVAYPKYKLFVGSAGFVGVFAAAFIYASLNIEGFAEFRGQRIVAWLQPEKVADQKLVFQSVQALYSIGSGGLWGKGLGNGTQKMILPEAMNDMIFAIICEEMGMIGAFLVMVMFAILLYRLMFIAKNSKDLLGGMIVTGIFAHFMVQVILNLGVVTGLLPSTGVTLPFISYGGTAMVLLMAEVGIALNVSRHIDFEQTMVRRRRKRPASQ